MTRHAPPGPEKNIPSHRQETLHGWGGFFIFAPVKSLYHAVR